MAMRVHISLDDDLLEQLDRRVEVRQRSRFIAEAVRRALDDEHRWELIESSVGAIADSGHEWDDDAADWVHRQRRVDERRVG